MDRPDFTRRQVVDRFLYEYGFNVYGGPRPDVPTGGTGFCGLEWQPLADGRLLVIGYEHPDNPGRSVTNAAEDIAQQFAEAAGVDVSRLVWVESCGDERAGLRSSAGEGVPGERAGREACSPGRGSGRRSRPDPSWAARLRTAT